MNRLASFGGEELSCETVMTPCQGPRAPSIRRAVIDIGTNSVKVLLADVLGERVEPIWETSHQTRLGQGLYQNRLLQPRAIQQTLDVVEQFASGARQRGATCIRLIATSAAREALNARELTDAIHQKCGLKVEVLSGDQEADLAFQGVTTDPGLAGESLLLLDIGGGSTEFILGYAGHQHFRASFPLGSVRLLETLPHSDPPSANELQACRNWLQAFLAREVKPRLDNALQQARSMFSGACTGQVDEHGQAVQLIGTGGTATILARLEAGLENFDREAIEATRIDRDQLQRRVEHLWSLPLARRKQLIGLPPNRADVILMGAVILEAVLLGFDFKALRISTRGLRFALVKK